jgi:protein-ribulosamine 3-kinase
MNPIDWQVVRQLLIEKTGLKFDQLEATPMPGGDINRAWRFSDGQHHFFIKTNSRERLPMFEAEMFGLDAMYCCDDIRVPQSIGCGVAGAQAFIAMEYLDLSGRPDEALFARQLAAMHQNTQHQFGFAIDNTIGSTPQINSFSEDWIDFWQQHRLGYQLSLAKINGYGNELYDSGMRLNQQIDRFYRSYRPLASLLHGDLWSGNWAADKTGKPVIYDPACYYGDHEADLAMMELFGSPGQRFFAAYNEIFPIAAGYSQRKELYNLYHVLNHANLFGGSYVSQAQRMIASLLVQT